MSELLPLVWLVLPPLLLHNALTGWRDGKRFWPIVSLWLALVNAIFYIEAVLS